MATALTSHPGDDHRQRAMRLLRALLVVGVVDLVLLLPLIGGVALGQHQLAPVLGPIHGVGFLIEVLLAAKGAGERFWGWWYPAAILLTGGPLGLAIGHRRAKAGVLRAGDAS